jgi:hypothetical protein
LLIFKGPSNFLNIFSSSSSILAKLGVFKISAIAYVNFEIKQVIFHNPFFCSVNLKKFNISFLFLNGR